MAEELARAVVRIQADVGDFQAGLKLASDEMSKVGAELEKMGKAMSLKVTLPLTIAAGIAVKEFAAEADAIERVNVVLAATNNISGQTTAGILAMADALEATTRFSDTQVIASAGLLATFKQVRNEIGAGNDIFDRTIKTAADLSSVMGSDLTTATMQLGRALEQPAHGMIFLRRAGIQFSEQEKFQIKQLVEHGRILEAQRVILDKVAEKTKGAAEAMAKTPAGQFAQAWNAIKDAMEGVGAILVQVLVPLAQLVKKAADAFQALPPAVQTVIVILGTLLALIGPLTTGLIALGKAAAFAKTMFITGGAASGVAAGLGVIKTAVLALTTTIGIAISAAVVGLGLIAAAYIDMRMTVAAEAAAAAAATKHLMDSFQSLSPEQVERRIVRFNETIDKYQKEVDALSSSLLQAALAQGMVADATATGMTTGTTEKLTQDEIEARQARIKALKELIANMDVARKALKDLAAANGTTSERINSELVAALLEADAKLKQMQLSTAGLAQVMGPSFNEAGIRAQALEAHMKGVADAMAKAGKTAGQIAARLRAEGKELEALKLEAAIKDSTRALENANKQATILGRTLGPSFSMSAARAAALRAQIDQTIAAMLEAGDSVDEVARAVLEMGIKWRQTNFAAGIEEVNKQLDHSVQEAMVFRQVFGASFDASAATAAALRANIESTVRTMIAEGKALDVIIERVRQLGIDWQTADLTVKLQAMSRELEHGSREAEILGKVFGPTFSVSAQKADALRAMIQSIVREMVLAGKTTDEIIAKIGTLGDELRRLEEKARIGEFFIDQLRGMSDALVEFAFAAENPAALQAEALREQIKLLEDRIASGGDETGELTMELVRLQGELVSAEAQSQSFFATLGQLVRDAVKEFMKLLLQMQLMKLIMGFATPDIMPGVDTSGFDASVLSDIPVPKFAAGGRLGPGKLGIVGESGPELIRAGRSGASIAPLSPMNQPGDGAGLDGGMTVPVTVNVSAIDSRDVARFFSENDALVATAVTRSVQRSVALRRALSK